MKHSIIPLFIPHQGCPHQCVFCNQVRITGRATPVSARDVAETIHRYVSGVSEPRVWEAAFYGGSFTALPRDVMIELLTPAFSALKAGVISKIRLSTRPDYIDDAVLSLLSRYGVTTVELGVQSLDERVLLLSEREHTAADAEKAVAMLRSYGMTVGLQFMVGLPGEDGRSLRHTARKGALLCPDFIRLYPVLVLKDTKLDTMRRNHQYEPLRLEEAVFRCAFLKRWYARHGIPVIRTGLQATEELDRGTSITGGPYHAAMGELTEQAIVRHAIRKRLLAFSEGSPVTIVCHPRDRSKLAGHKKETWHWVLSHFPGSLCREDPSLREGEFRIEGGHHE